MRADQIAVWDATFNAWERMAARDAVI